MAKPQKIKKGINLLEETTAPKTFWEKFYVWALSIGRFIVVGTEAIVLLVFIARFSLDRNINDLNDSLTVKANILKTLSAAEENSRTIQNLLFTLNDLRTNQIKRADTYNSLLSLITEGTTVTTFQIENDNLLINATSESVGKFNAFENSFKRSPLLQEVTIPVTETEPLGTDIIYKFTLRAKIKTEQ